MSNVDVAAMMARRRATDEQFGVFVTGLDAVLMQWTALNLVTQHADSTAAQALRDYLVEWFAEVGEVYSDELEGYFDDFFMQTRFASIEDGSQKEVADCLHGMYCECCHDNDASVRTYIASLDVYRASGVAEMCQFERGAEDADSGADDDGGAGDYDDNDDDGAYEEPPPPQQQQQPKAKKNGYVNSGGGWKTVTSRR